MNYYFDVLKKYVVFSGRATRKEYWMFFLFNVIVSIVLSLVDTFLGTHIVIQIYTLAILLPSLTVLSRRLHDTGRSAWWILIGLVPFIGGFVLIIFAILDSQTGTNKYGDNPKGNTYVSQKANVVLIVILVIVAVALMMVAVSAAGLKHILDNTRSTEGSSVTK